MSLSSDKACELRQQYATRYRFLRVFAEDFVDVVQDPFLQYCTFRKPANGKIYAMLVGAVSGSEIHMNRVRIFEWDTTSENWQVYDGPFLNYVKWALAYGDFLKFERGALPCGPSA